jgi:hypothetical protein
LNGPHEFDKHGPVPKENRHEEIGERAIAALNSTTDKSVTTAGVGSCDLLFKPSLGASRRRIPTNGCQANGTYRGRMQWIEVRDIEFNLA